MWRLNCRFLLTLGDIECSKHDTLLCPLRCCNIMYKDCCWQLDWFPCFFGYLIMTPFLLYTWIPSSRIRFVSFNTIDAWSESEDDAILLWKLLWFLRWKRWLSRCIDCYVKRADGTQITWKKILSINWKIHSRL